MSWRSTALSRRFGRTLALDGVDLEIPRGSVFGVVGENGAGKTTMIKHLMGLLKAQSGTVRVFGRDPVQDPVGVLSRDRLPERGPRPARLDDDRGGAALSSGVLPGLGR